MKNHIEAEKHLNGTQIYLNDKSYAWYGLSKEREAAEAIARYIVKFNSDVEYTKARYRTRHFKLNWDNCTLDELKIFYREMCEVIIAGEYFRAGIGELYLTVRGIESEREEIATTEDVMHKFRRLIRIEKHLARKPPPQNRWRGNWIDIFEIVEAAQISG